MMAAVMRNNILQRRELGYLMLKAALERFEKPPRQLDTTQIDQIRKLAEKEFDLQTLILASDEARDVVLPDASIDAALKEIEARYEDEATFVSDLESNGIDLNQLRGALYRELKVDTVLARVSSRMAAISDLDITIYYHLHKQRFTKPETRVLRHILITINPNFAENTRECAHQRASAIAKRLSRKPERFEEQAMKHSECPTALHGGLLGELPRGKLYPELDAVAFELTPGEISDVVESPVGFHILLCDRNRDASVVSLEEARPKIRELLEKRRRRMCQRTWLAQLTNVAAALPDQRGKQ